MGVSTVSTIDLAVLAGATERQIDYWVSKDIFTPIARQRWGSGFPRLFDEEIVKKVRLISRVSIALEKRVRTEFLRRIFNNYEEGRLELGDGIVLIWEVE